MKDWTMCMFFARQSDAGNSGRPTESVMFLLASPAPIDMNGSAMAFRGFDWKSSGARLPSLLPPPLDRTIVPPVRSNTWMRDCAAGE